MLTFRHSCENRNQEKTISRVPVQDESKESGNSLAIQLYPDGLFAPNRDPKLEVHGWS